jgi:hypothetical protein
VENNGRHHGSERSLQGAESEHGAKEEEEETATWLGEGKEDLQGEEKTVRRDEDDDEIKEADLLASPRGEVQAEEAAAAPTAAATAATAAAEEEEQSD